MFLRRFIGHLCHYFLILVQLSAIKTIKKIILAAACFYYLLFFNLGCIFSFWVFVFSLFSAKNALFSFSKHFYPGRSDFHAIFVKSTVVKMFIQKKGMLFTTFNKCSTKITIKQKRLNILAYLGHIFCNTIARYITHNFAKI